jgi:predicted dehydrogenase
MSKINWGILGTARIAVRRVIPAIQETNTGRVHGIASRDGAKAKQVSGELSLSRWYASYEDMLSDPDIQAVYNPLPNHLHLPYTLAALHAGKHVLIEKPLACNAEQAQELYAAVQRYPHLKVMEAFMYRFHPQWKKVRELMDSGALGIIKTIHTWFSYFSDDPLDYRQNPQMGGGALLDVGCYCISAARMLFADEPNQVLGVLDIDPRFGIDRMASAQLLFSKGTATFTCGSQLAENQYVHIYGDKAALLVETPFIPPLDRPVHLYMQNEEKREEILLPPQDHFVLQCEAFQRAILENQPVPWPIADSVHNMQIIDAVSASHSTHAWVSV